MEWEENMPDEFIKLAYKAGGELAWQKVDAVEVIRWLIAHGYEVIGIDVWLRGHDNAPRMTAPYIYAWELDSNPTRDSFPTAESYVESFEWGLEDSKNADEIAYFNMTVRQCSGAIN